MWWRWVDVSVFDSSEQTLTFGGNVRGNNVVNKSSIRTERNEFASVRWHEEIVAWEGEATNLSLGGKPRDFCVFHYIRCEVPRWGKKYENEGQHIFKNLHFRGSKRKIRSKLKIKNSRATPPPTGHRGCGERLQSAIHLVPVW